MKSKTLILPFSVIIRFANGAPAVHHERAADALSGYEYVVVGSGAGGGPLASRLALAGHKTLLIEAGDDQGGNVFEQVPTYNIASTEDPRMMWNYYVKHYADENRQAQDFKAYPGKGVWYPRSGTLGGCTAHNALITATPFESDWNDIAALTGDSSWSSESMRYYFQRLENNQYLPPGTKGHGFGGWFGVERTNKIFQSDARVESWFKAAASVAAGGTASDPATVAAQTAKILSGDLNEYVASRDTTEAVYQIPLATLGGKRNGPREFLLSVAGAKNADGSKRFPLDIRTNCLVTKVTFDTTTDKNTPRATGVEFLDGKSVYSADPRHLPLLNEGTPGSVQASKEVIISAGAFNTPQLLKLSGVGPAAELQQFNIPVVKDLPGVGTNLQDRYEAAVVYESSDDFTFFGNCRYIPFLGIDPCYNQWQAGAPRSKAQDNDGGHKPWVQNIDPSTQNRGVYASNGAPAGTLHRSSKARTSEVDTFMFGAPIDFRGYFHGYTLKALAQRNHFTWAILKAHTGNRAGTVTLNSASPRDVPEINFNYFDTGTNTDGADDRDLNAVVEGILHARDIAKQVNANTVGGTQYTEVFPGPDVQTRQQLEDYVRNTAWGHHASCTCPIGADGDEMAVLDGQFRVRGVSGLRVVDASAFPKIPGMFIAVPTYMISEKAADSILGLSPSPVAI